MHMPLSNEQVAEPVAIAPPLEQPMVPASAPSEAAARHRSAWGRFLSGPAAGRSALALADQVVYSATTFLTAVIVGRFAGADQLGIYTLGFTVVIMLAAAQDALVTMPYVIRFNQFRRKKQRRFSGSVLVHCLTGALISTLCLLIVAGLVSGISRFASVAPTFWVISIVLPWILLREFARRYLMAHLRMATALAVESGVAALHLGGLWWLITTDSLSAPTVFAVMGGACGLTAIAWLVAYYRDFSIRKQSVKLDLGRNWEMARWIFVGLLTHMLQFTAIVWLLTFQIGTAAAGLFAACMSIVNLSSPLARSINNVLMPSTALAFRRKGAQSVRQISYRVAGLLGGCMLLFCLVLAAAGDRAILALYGDRYGGHQLIVTLLAIAALFRSLEMVAYNGLLVIERPQTNFWINAASLVLLLILTPSLTLFWGVAGAAASALAVAGLATAARWIAFLATLQTVGGRQASASIANQDSFVRYGSEAVS